MERQLAEQASDKTESNNSLSILAASQILVRDGLDAQKGSKVATDGLLDTADWLKNNGLLNEVMTRMEDGGFAKVSRKQDGTPKEIVFDREIPGYPKNPVKLDLDKMEINNKSKETIDKQAALERKDFVDALSLAPNRPRPEGESKALSNAERKTLQQFEENLSTGNLDAIKKAFQANPKNSALWKRIASEVSTDFNSPPAMSFGKGPDGKPYLAVIGEVNTSSADFDAIVIPSSGNPQVFGLNDMGDIDFKKAMPRNPEESMKAQHSFRKSELETKMSDYLCDFDQHERTPNSKLGAFSQKTMVEKYNSYTEHFCGSEFQD